LHFGVHENFMQTAHSEVSDGRRGAFYRDISILVKGAVTREWRTHCALLRGVTFMDARKPRAPHDWFVLRE